VLCGVTIDTTAYDLLDTESHHWVLCFPTSGISDHIHALYLVEAEWCSQSDITVYPTGRDVGSYGGEGLNVRFPLKSQLGVGHRPS
jgi:hypothetical protein